MRAPVFIYHGFHRREDELGLMPAPERRYSLPLSRFRRHVEWLSDQGLPATSLNDAAGNGAVLTFDDGNCSDYTHVCPLLDRFGFRATFFVVASWIGRPDRLGISEIREMHCAGMEIGSHGLTHAPLTGLPGAALAEELRRSKDVLEQVLGAPVRHFAAPGGAVNRRVTRAVFEAGYERVCTSQPGFYGQTRVVPRLSITSHTSMRRFQELARTNRAEVIVMRGEYAARRMLKRVTGIAGYERLVERVSGLCHREPICR